MNETGTTDARDPAEIEREIRNTQAEMSRTVDQIGDQLTPRNLFNGLLDKAEESGVDARYLVDGARRNPLALAMIALGGIWLASDSDAKVSSIKATGIGSLGDKLGNTYDSMTGSKAHDDHHRGYVEHMSRCEPQIDEDETAYRRRRDRTRSSYLMIEQGHEEDEGAFRKRLDEATDALRRRRHDLMESAQEMGRTANTSARDAAARVGETYDANPLIGGIIAALVGAIAGSVAPVTRMEEEQLGKIGAGALKAAQDQARGLADVAREKKDELLNEADEKIGEIGTPTRSQDNSGDG